MNKAILEARVRGVNKAHKYANELYPRLVETFKPFVGGKIETVGGSLLKKVDDKVKTLDLPNGGGIQVYRYTSRHSLAYTVKTWEQVNGIAYYYEVTMFFGNMDGAVLTSVDNLPRNFKIDYNADEVIANREAYEKAKEAASEAQGKLHPFGEYDR